MNMFCYQCEQTAFGTGCTIRGVCGKTPDAASLQDLLIYVAKGISMYARRARDLGEKDADIDRFIPEALFTTVTNVNFDPEHLREIILKGVRLRDRAKAMYEAACKKAGKSPESLNGSATWSPAASMQGMLEQTRNISIPTRMEKFGKDIAGLQELLTYGLKGTGAYDHHALILEYEDVEAYAFFHEALDYLTREDPTADALLAMCLKCGDVNLKVMGLLDKANTGTYGDPVPTPVRIHPLKGKAILVSGHDLKDLEEILKQSEGKGINVYTHGEMLPCHGYPGLKKYKHLVGNYGGPWQKQWKEFDEFPGAIVMTTNCIQEPRPSYKNRIFTCGVVGWHDVVHIKNHDFAPVIEAALREKGFKKDGPADTILVGFGHNAVLGVADKVIDAVKKGVIRHFFLIGGCDGAKPGRDYYTRLAELVPKDCMILTLACGKYRFNKLNFGTVAGLPRLLDIGQCNDSYSAIQIALALANAFKTDVNSLPLSLILSWYEQKAVCILLTLLSLGIKNMRLGPSLPAYVTPPVLQVLVDKFNIIPITTPEADLKAILG